MPQKTSSRTSTIEGILYAFSRKDPRAAARCAEVAPHGGRDIHCCAHGSPSSQRRGLPRRWRWQGTSLAAIKRYYLETLKTLRSHRNAVGTGMCLHSLGEIALVAGAISEARICWRRARQYLESSARAEARQLDAWLSLLET